MFAVGSNEEAARVSGVNVFMTILMVFVLAGVMYGITGFIEALVLLLALQTQVLTTNVTLLRLA